MHHRNGFDQQRVDWAKAQAGEEYLEQDECLADGSVLSEKSGIENRSSKRRSDGKDQRIGEQIPLTPDPRQSNRRVEEVSPLPIAATFQTVSATNINGLRGKRSPR